LGKLIDITGHRYNLYTVISYAGLLNKRTALFLCRCDCGTEKVVRSNSLRTGAVQSCGCITKERHPVKHGKTYTAEYNVWGKMKSRCYSPSDIGYRHYGGRGIWVCERWLNDFSAFWEDMGPRPSTEHSIDRIDPNGNYEPSNCRWATRREQVFSRRCALWLTVNGVRKPLDDWAKETGIAYRTLRYRMQSTRMTPEEVVSTPVAGSRRS
jgi:hypothetical protein